MNGSLMSAHFQGGFLLAAIVLTAAILSPALRAVGAGVMAVIALWVLYEHGPDGLATIVGVLRWKLTAKPQFIQGLVAGAAITAVIFVCLKRRGSRAQ